MKLNDFDVIIVGSGMMGLAIAKDLADCAIDIAIIAPNVNEQYPLVETPFVRASAINHSSENYFKSLNIWSDILEKQRIYTYQEIKVREKNSSARLQASGDDFNLSNLGYIIENHYIQGILLEKLKQHKNITLIENHVDDIQVSEERSFLYLNDRSAVSAKLVIAADGAQSSIRQKLETPLIQKPYKHHAIVATIKTSLPHDGSAKQLFYPDGIVAFLPLWKEHHHCLVWSTLPDNAQRLTAISKEAFNQELSDLTEYWEGECSLVSEPFVFPLIARYTPKFVQSRVILIGDAAHTIHPLAGQGANLGLRDAEQLGRQIKKLLKENRDIGNKKEYLSYQISRNADTLSILAGMQIIHDMFHGDIPPKKWIRGIGMNLINHSHFTKKLLIKKALGI